MFLHNVRGAAAGAVNDIAAGPLQGRWGVRGIAAGAPGAAKRKAAPLPPSQADPPPPEQ